DQHRVVLGPARQDLHDPLDLFLTTDHRIELVLPGELRQVSTELIEHRGALPRALAPATGGNLLLAPGVSGQQLDHGLTNAVEVCSELLQHLSGDAFTLADQPEEDVLGADVVVVEHPRFFLRENHDAPGAIRESLEHLTRPPGRGPLPLLAARGSQDHVLPPRYIGRRGSFPSARTDRVYPCPYEPLEPPSVANTLSFLRFVSASGLVPPHVE